MRVNPSKITAAMAAIQYWAKDQGLKPSETNYVARTSDHRQLRFSASGDTATERAYRTHWVSPDLPERAVERQSRPPELVVIWPVKEWTCASCGDTFLPAGDAALTRRAKKASPLSSVVVRWSRSRKRYERQGILAEAEAIERAEQECLSDAELRARRRERDQVRRADEDVRFQERLAAAIRELYPGRPASRAEAIARHAAARSTGCIGRGAAGQALDPDAVRLAVAASVRHIDTRYDEMLMSGVDRETARDQVRDRVEEVLSTWRDGAAMLDT
jgi:hypothetical protein